jgi:hypothetical protein
MARNQIRFLVEEIEEVVVQAAREASVRIMNSLAERGPVWSGSFSSAWYAVPEGGTPGGPRSEGKVYKYDLRNVPKRRFSAASKTYFQIVNGAAHAGLAMDMDEGIFKAQSEPIDLSRVEFGRRPRAPETSRRGAIGSGESIARRTAPLDWYENYVQGGGLQKDLNLGVSKAFSSTRGKGFG